MDGAQDGTDRARRATRGQSTVEYAIALLAVLAAIYALGRLWRVANTGQLSRRAERAGSHQIGGDDALGAWKDVSLF